MVFKFKRNTHGLKRVKPTGRKKTFKIYKIKIKQTEQEKIEECKQQIHLANEFGLEPDIPKSILNKVAQEMLDKEAMNELFG